MSTTQLKKMGAIAGILFPIMQMASQALIQIGGAEPPFTAPAAEILAFFQNRDATLAPIGGYISLLSIVVFLWFLGALWSQMRAAEGEHGMLSAIALGSGLITAAAIIGEGGWSLALFRLDEGLEAETARLLFDQGNLNFANIWISLGSLVLAAGILFLRTGAFPGWLGWSSVVLAIGLFLARTVWTSQIAFLPYVLFWVWMIVLGIMLFRRGTPQ